MKVKEQTRCIVPDRLVGLLIFVCCGAYFSSYLGRLSYSACLVDLIESTGESAKAAGLVSSMLFVGYATGQLINSFAVRYVNSRYMVFTGLILSSIMNVIMPFCGSVGVMKWVWILNGLFQSMLWSNVVNIYTRMLPDKAIPRAVMIIHAMMGLGTLLIYGIAALCMEFFTWKIVFFCAAAIMTAAAFMWLIWIGRFEKLGEQTQPEQKSVTPEETPAAKPIGFFALFFTAGIAVATVCALMNGGLRDGMNTWAPTFITSTYGTTPAFSTLVTLGLPLMSIFGSILSRVINKYIKSGYMVAALMFGASLVLLVLMFTLPQLGMLFACLIMALVSGMMTGITSMIVSIVPMKLRRYGFTAVFSGMLDFFCYIGSAIFSYGMGAISEKLGWNSVMTVLAILAGVATLAAVLGGLVWKRFAARNGLAL